MARRLGLVRLATWLAATLVIAAGSAGPALGSQRAPGPAAVGSQPLVAAPETIVFSSLRTGNGDLYSVQPDGTGLTRLTTSSAFDGFPSLSPDGTRVAFVSTRDGNAEIYVMNLDGTSLVRLTNNKAVDAEPEWSPDGKRIVFSSTRTGNGDLYAMSATDGSGLLRLTTDTALDASPAWSPDGTAIAFSSLRSGAGDIYRMKADGSAQTRLTTNAAADLFPAWSPDGSRIAFSSLRTGNSDLYLMKPDGTAQTRITSAAAIETEPTWSPDGKRLAFSSNTASAANFDIRVINADGTGGAPLAANPAVDASPDWGGAAPKPFDGNVSPVVDSAHSVSKTIGLAGGTITAGAGTLTIPRGALPGDTAITMTPLTSIAGSPLGQLAAGFQFEPSGLRFLYPATLTFSLPTGTSPATIVGFGFDGSGQNFHLVPHAATGATISILMAHFSGSGASAASPVQVAAALGYTPTQADAAAHQLVAAAVAQGLTGTALEDVIDRAYHLWYQSSVGPGLDPTVIGDRLDFLQLAISDWFEWLGNLDQADFDHHLDQASADHLRLAADKTAAQALAVKDTAHIGDFLLARCTGGGADPFAPLNDLLPLQTDLDDRGADHFIEIAGVSATLVSPPKPLPAAPDLLRACVQVVMSPLTTPDHFAIGLSAVNPVSTDLSETFWNGPARTNISLDVELTPLGHAPISQTITTGHFTTTLPVGSSDQPAIQLSINAGFTAAASNPLLDKVAAGTTKVVPVRPRIDLKGRGPTDPASTYTDTPNPLNAGQVMNLDVLVAGNDMAHAPLAYTLTGPGTLSSASGTSDPNGEATLTYTAPSSVTGSPVTASIGVTVGSGATAGTDTLAIEIDPITVVVAPSTVTLAPGARQQFTATVTGTNDHGVTWLDSAGGIDPQTGLYTAPSTPGTYTIDAFSNADVNAIGRATVTVVAPRPVQFVAPTPIGRILPAGGSSTLCALIENSAGVAVGSGTTVYFDVFGPGSQSAYSALTDGSGTACIGYAHPSTLQPPGTVANAWAHLQPDNFSLTQADHVQLLLQETQLVVTTTSLPDGAEGLPYPATYASSNAGGPVTWSASGLPSGMTILTSGAIGGTPSTGGVYSVTLTATTAAQTASSQPIRLMILAPLTFTGTLHVTTRHEIHAPPPGPTQHFPIDSVEVIDYTVTETLRLPPHGFSGTYPVTGTVSYSRTWTVSGYQGYDCNFVLTETGGGAFDATHTASTTAVVNVDPTSTECDIATPPTGGAGGVGDPGLTPTNTTFDQDGDPLTFDYTYSGSSTFDNGVGGTDASTVDITGQLNRVN